MSAIPSRYDIRPSGSANCVRDLVVEGVGCTTLPTGLHSAGIMAHIDGPAHHFLRVARLQ